MSVCDPVGGMHSLWTGVLPAQVFAGPPPAGFEPGYAAELRDLVERHSHELAAVIVEPVVQGAGGMRFHHPGYLRVLREVTAAHGILLIFDEIATGFGRTGTLFAADQAGVAPDVMCLGKALTGGYLSLAATLCTPAVARAVSAGQGGGLAHGPTFMGNPLACAVANASIGLLRAGGWAGEVERIGRGLRAALEPLRGASGVADVRVLGAIGVVQLDHDVDLPRATAAAVAEGVWLRPFRDLIYTMPPYVTDDADLARIAAGIAAAVAAA
jgi:adenosylmethionine-8-amino-7-oxononanoate aminotransferase